MYHFIILLYVLSSFSLTRLLFIPYVYFSLKSVDYIPLSSFEFKTILFISSVRTPSLSLLNLFCVSNINLLFFCEFFMLSSVTKEIIYVILIFFLGGLFYSQIELLLKGFYNFQFYVFFLWHTALCLLLFYFYYYHLLGFCS